MRDDPTPLYHKCKILKLSDHIKLENFCYIHDSLRGNLPLPLKNVAPLANQIHDINTRGACMYKMTLPKVKTQTFGINSISYQSVATWNFIVSVIQNKKLHAQSKAYCKRQITEFFIDSYS